MIRRTATHASLILVSAAVVALLAGCTQESPDAETPTAVVPSPAASADQALAPSVVTPGDLDGTDVSVVIATSLVLAVPDGTEAEWTGTTDDVSIAEFSGGGPSEGAVFRPGFTARSLGTTAATLTGPDGKTESFRISVVAP